jgi:hypothetical protein
MLLFNLSQIVAVIGPMIIFVIIYIRKRNVYDLHHAILGNFTTAIVFSGLL